MSSSRRQQKPTHPAVITKRPQSPFFAKDDVAKQSAFVHRRFQLMDSNQIALIDAPWLLADDVAPTLPNWKLLLQDELYAPEQEVDESVRKRYAAFALPDKSEIGSPRGEVRTTHHR